jgi:mannose/cellobiose epimerase-like protein (N-acyl-D-glucosamine 2-epimerase family)
MWTYAYLYNNFGADQRHLDIALRSRDLLARSRPAAPDELRPTDLHRDGSPAGPADPEVYSDLFVAEGLIELARATGDDAIGAEARATVLRCITHYDSPTYAPQVGQTYLGTKAPALPGARVLGVWMVLIRTISQLLELRPDEEMDAVMQRCLQAVFERHLNPRFQLLNELLNHDMSPAPTYDRLVYLGHAIETLWMVLSEARRRSDATLFERAAELFRRHCDVAIDRVYGGLFRCLLDVDEATFTLDKTLFVHQEALIGSLLLMEAGDSWAGRFHESIETYTRAAFPLEKWGSPLWRLVADRRADDEPAEERVENYHHPRFLMLSLQTLDRMLHQ